MRNFLFSHLWDFVSKFTEYDAKKLYKLYKHAVKKAKPEKDVEEKVSYLLTMIPKYNIYFSCPSKYHLNLAIICHPNQPTACDLFLVRILSVCPIINLLIGFAC